MGRTTGERTGCYNRQGMGYYNQQRDRVLQPAETLGSSTSGGMGSYKRWKDGAVQPTEGGGVTTDRRIGCHNQQKDRVLQPAEVRSISTGRLRDVTNRISKGLCKQSKRAITILHCCLPFLHTLKELLNYNGKSTTPEDAVCTGALLTFSCAGSWRASSLPRTSLRRRPPPRWGRHPRPLRAVGQPAGHPESKSLTLVPETTPAKCTCRFH